MKSSLNSNTNRYLKACNRRHRLYVLFPIMCVLIVLITVYILISPAYSNTNNTICNMNEHTHSDECYATHTGGGEKVLICRNNYTDEVVSHIHDSFCYDDNGKLICPLEEINHIHDASCYNDSNELVCGVIVHQHNEDCFGILQDDESADVLICGENVHQHTDECYESLSETDSDESAATTAEDSDDEDDVEEENEVTDFKDTIFYNTCVMVLDDEETADETVQSDDSSTTSVDPVDLNEKNDDGSYKYIKEITLSYLDENKNWVEITGADGEEIPGNANVRFNVSYQNVLVSLLQEHGNTMMLENIPDWITTVKSGKLVDGSEIVADFNIQQNEDGTNTALITFYDSYLEKQPEGTYLEGSFYIRGTVNWDELNDNTGAIDLPNLNLSLINFEGDLASKYGEVQIEKTESEPIEIDGNTYIKYTIKVTSPNNAELPAIRVEDSFTLNSQFVEYVNISSTETTLADSYNSLNPYETRNADSSAGSVKLDSDGKLIWNIGTANLYGDHSRTLTYYVKLSPNYVGSTSRGNLKNTASVYSGKNLKDDDTETFTPSISSTLKKSRVKADINGNGDGTISYQVTVSAPAENSYSLVNLRLHDYFNSDLANYLSGDDEGNITITANGESSTVPYSNAEFNYTIPKLSPGESITITYTVNVYNIFAAGNDVIDLQNIAQLYTETNSDRGSASNNRLCQTASYYTLDQNQWIRKLYGGDVSITEVNIPDGDRVYAYDGSSITTADNPGKFTLPTGSKVYHIIVNENGTWNVSSTTMEDSFQNNYMKYTGYLKIEAFNLADIPVATSVGDSDALSTFENATPAETVWVNINDLQSFKFEPTSLGFTDTNYSYMLTYYSISQNLENVGSATISNDFSISGDVGLPSGGDSDSDGEKRHIDGVHVTVSNVIQGGLEYTVEKNAWYYTEDRTENYTVATWNLDYAKGVAYWIIKLEGTIPEGFGVHDKKTDYYVSYSIDSLAGIYIGPSDFDITENYDSFGEFDGTNNREYLYDYDAKYYGDRDNFDPTTENKNYENDGFRKLIGTPFNPKSDPNRLYLSYNKNPDQEYTWEVTGTDSKYGMYITFKNGYDLSETNQAIYIIVRMGPNSYNSSNIDITNADYLKGEKSYAFHNEVWTASNASTGDYIFNDSATCYASRAVDVYKDAYVGFIYDNTGKTDTYTSCSPDVSDATSYFDTMKGDNAPSTSGTYAEWGINVNWSGKLSGSAIVSDILPEGLELEYTDVLWIGSQVQNDPPRCVEIPELENSEEWVRYSKTYQTPNNKYPNQTSIAYYNPKTREIRWKVENLTSSGSDQIISDSYQINLRILCKVTDEKILLQGSGTNGNTVFTNTATATMDDGTTYQSSDSVTIHKDSPISKEISAAIDETAEIPFQIEINHNSEQLSDGKTLPPLIDELSDTMTFVYGSLTIKDKDGHAITGYSYKIETNDNGQEVLSISKLPDKVDLIIQYRTRLLAKPDETVTINNIAYWSGYDKPDTPQVDNVTEKYEIAGSSNAVQNPKFIIIKVDSDNYDKKLSGATFELYQITTDANGQQTSTLINSGITDAEGQLVFDKSSNGNPLSFNTVYYVKETKAPNGYTLDEQEYYFVIVYNTDTDFKNYTVNDVPVKVNAVYTGFTYTCIVPNSKGKISVEKSFIDTNGNTVTPESGTYRFGLYDTDPDDKTEPIQILTINYSNGEASYLIDDSPILKPNFTMAEGGILYYVYELDDDGKPIKNQAHANANGHNYKVEYSVNNSVGNALVTNNTIRITNTEQQYELPKTGGKGRRNYYLIGTMLVIFSVISLGASKLSRMRRKN